MKLLPQQLIHVMATCLMACSVVHADDKPVGSVNPSKSIAPELKGFHERLERIRSDLHVAGIAVAVVRGDEIIYVDAAGIRDPKTQQPTTPDSMFYIASCTKVFNAMAVKILVEEGKINLDAPVKKYLPRFRIADQALTETLTVRDLLCHSKGIDSDPAVWLDAFTGEITEDRYYHWISQAKSAGRHAYSNVHYTLAGRIIEAVSGQSWKDFLQERIFQPAGMGRSTCYASQMYGDNNAGFPSEWYEGALRRTKLRKDDSVMHAAGGMGASATDLARWLIVNLNEGQIESQRILSPAGIKEMQTLQAKGTRRYPSYLNRASEGHGLGWSIGTYRNERFIEHGGGYAGTSATISFMPEHNIGVAVVSNSSAPAAHIVSMEIYNRLLGLEVEDVLPKIKKSMEKHMRKQARAKDDFAKNPTVKGGLSLPPDAYVGLYENNHWGTIRIDYKDGKLVGQSGILCLQFSSTGMDSFLMGIGFGSPEVGRFEMVKSGGPPVIILHPDGMTEEVRYERESVQ